MIVTTMRMDGSTYALASGQDLGAIRGAVVRAAQAGGGLVDFQTAGGRALSVLVTGAMPLMFEQREVMDESEEYDSGSWARADVIDFDGFP